MEASNSHIEASKNHMEASKSHMEASTSPIDQQSRLIQQLSHQQAQLSVQQLSNIQTVKKTIKKYQSKISEMIKVIQKQKKHNDLLKGQLKSLNQSLNNMIQKINVKNIKKDDTNREDVIKKTLENQIKKSHLMKKQLDTLRAKVKVFQGQKIMDIQDQIRQKDKVIQQLNNTIKMYSKIQKQQMNSDIYKKYAQANQKINTLNGQLIHFKKKFTQTKKHEQQQQKSIKRQHQQLLSIQNRQKGNLSVVKKQQIKYEQSINESKQLKDKIESLDNAKKTNEKALKIQIDSLKLKNKLLEEQLENSKSQLNRKDKQFNILLSKTKEMSRKSHPNLQPVQKLSFKDQLHANTSSLFDNRKQFKGLMHIPSSCRKFDDSNNLSLQKSYKIKTLQFSWFEQHILALATTYQLPNQQNKIIQSFSIDHSYKNIKTAELIFTQFQYIKEIQIYCSKFIEFIRIRTSRQHLLEVGNQKNYTKCKKFTFDIRTNQKPISIMGAIQTKKLGNQNSKEHLISIGLQIKKKEIFTKNKFQSAGIRSDSLRKAASKTGFNSLQHENDKNIILEQQPIK